MSRVADLTVAELRDLLHDVVEEILDDKLGLWYAMNTDLELRLQIVEAMRNYLICDQHEDVVEAVLYQHYSGHTQVSSEMKGDLISRAANLTFDKLHDLLYEVADNFLEKSDLLSDKYGDAELNTEVIESLRDYHQSSRYYLASDRRHEEADVLARISGR